MLNRFLNLKIINLTMKPKNALNLLTLMSLSCGRQTMTGKLYMRDDAAKILNLNTAASSKSSPRLARMADLTLSYRDLSEYQNELKKNSYYFLKFAPHARLADYLHHSSSLSLLYRLDHLNEGYAILRNPSAEELGMISSLYHNETQGLGCGALQQLSLLAEETESPFLGPLYREQLTLPEVPPLLLEASIDRLQATITTLENLGSRYYTSSGGLSTPQKIKDMIDQVASEYSFTHYSVELYSHSQFEQKSLIITLPGNASKGSEKVILGAHLDSINRDFSSTNTNAPGADDDASGIATLIEAFRIIAKNKLSFSRTIEFHAYAAEEVGLKGSEDIALAYRNKNEKVAAMLQIDMNAYLQDPTKQTIYIVTTSTNDHLRRSLKDLLNNYLQGDFIEKSLNAGKSDHVSWQYHGFPAVFPFEDPEHYNFNLHTGKDTIANINNLALTKRFTQASLAFLVHYGGALGFAESYQSKLSEYLPDEDLKVAVKNRDDQSEGVDLIVASSRSVNHVEACLADQINLGLCGVESKRLILSNFFSANERNFFAFNLEQDILLASEGTQIRIFAYDHDDKLLKERKITLHKK